MPSQHCGSAPSTLDAATCPAAAMIELDTAASPTAAMSKLDAAANPAAATTKLDTAASTAAASPTIISTPSPSPLGSRASSADAAQSCPPTSPVQHDVVLGWVPGCTPKEAGAPWWATPDALELPNFPTLDAAQSCSSASNVQHPFPDYQSLPSPPEVALSLYNPELGADVALAYKMSCFRFRLRSRKYGDEVARTWKRGSTPEEIRTAWWTAQQEALDRLNSPSPTPSPDGKRAASSPAPDETPAAKIKTG